MKYILDEFVPEKWAVQSNTGTAKWAVRSNTGAVAESTSAPVQTKLTVNGDGRVDAAGAVAVTDSEPVMVLKAVRFNASLHNHPLLAIVNAPHYNGKMPTRRRLEDVADPMSRGNARCGMSRKSGALYSDFKLRVK